ncbi:MAG: PEGA domain-containing protein [Myxococcota bacterium]|nr:PEGA domain-containing protein [Myxococcota bacterium]
MVLLLSLLSNSQAASYAILPIDTDNHAVGVVIENQLRGAVSEDLQNRLLTGKELSYQRNLIDMTAVCSKRSCAQEMGVKLGVDFIIYGEYSNDWFALQILDLDSETRVLSRKYNLETKRFDRIYTDTREALNKTLDQDFETHYANRYYQSFGKQSDYLFSAYPEGVSVWVDGQRVCESTPCSVSLESGTHSALFKKAGYQAEHWVFHTSQKFFPRLDGVPTTVELVDLDSSVEIWMGGSKIKRNAIDKYEVEPGSLSLSLLSSCYYNQTVALSLEVREQRKLSLDLKPLKQLIFIPKGEKREQVFVDGKFVGYTGEKLYVPRCAQSLHFGGIYHPIGAFQQNPVQ